MDKKETTVTQCLSTPVRDKPGSLLSENGGHSLLPSPLSPIPHTEAQTRALAHPRRRTREICGDYNPTFWKIHSQVRMHARTAEETRGSPHGLPSFTVNAAVIKWLQFRVRKEKPTLWSCPQNLEIPSTGAQRSMWFWHIKRPKVSGNSNCLRKCVLYRRWALFSGSTPESGINPIQSSTPERLLHVVKWQNIQVCRD